MSSTIGKNLKVTIFGESHGPYIGCVIEGLAPGVKIDMDNIRHMMDLRRSGGGNAALSTKRNEADIPIIVSGENNGYTAGTPLTILVANRDAKSTDYRRNIMRPSHADYTAEIKYSGYQISAGGGHFSGRLTAPIVAAGAIATQILADHGIHIGTHISKLGNIKDTSMEPNISDNIKRLNNSIFPVLDHNVAQQMQDYIKSAAAEGDSVGGILETYVYGMPAGIGEPQIDTLESVISHNVFAIPGVKGVEFGLGFGFGTSRGSEANDSLYYDDTGIVLTKTNNNGGINGGISNGMPIVMRVAMKPTPSIYKEQDTIDIDKKENTKLKIEGRHDPAIIHRARVVVDSMVALSLLDLIICRYGYMWQVMK